MAPRSMILSILFSLTLTSLAQAFEATYAVDPKESPCAVFEGQPLALVVTNRSTSGVLTDSTTNPVTMCSEPESGGNQEDITCKEPVKTSEFRSALIRLGTLQYALLNPKDSSPLILSESPIRTSIEATSKVTGADGSVEPWTNVSWSFNSRYSVLHTNILETSSISASLSQNSESFDRSITQVLKGNRFSLKKNSPVDTVAGIDQGFSNQILEDMVGSAMSINVYVKSCNGVVPAYRK